MPFYSTARGLRGVSFSLDHFVSWNFVNGNDLAMNAAIIGNANIVFLDKLVQTRRDAIVIVVFGRGRIKLRTSSVSDGKEENVRGLVARGNAAIIVDLDEARDVRTNFGDEDRRFHFVWVCVVCCFVYIVDYNKY